MKRVSYWCNVNLEIYGWYSCAAWGSFVLTLTELAADSVGEILDGGSNIYISGGSCKAYEYFDIAELYSFCPNLLGKLTSNELMPNWYQPCQLLKW